MDAMTRVQILDEADFVSYWEMYEYNYSPRKPEYKNIYCVEGYLVSAELAEKR